MDKAEEYTERIKEANRLRKEINYKKQVFAKLLNIPEALSECLVIKSEIECLEKELENLR